MERKIREIIEAKLTPGEDLKETFLFINDMLKETGGLSSKLFHFSRSVKMAGVDNRKLERARVDFDKYTDELTSVMHDIMKELNIDTKK